jgi:hypothetical protein
MSLNPYNRMNNNISFSPEIIIPLTKAGWFPGRQVANELELPSDVEYPADVFALLSEYGRLKVRSEGAGINTAKNSIDFDPTWAEQESSEDGRLYYYSNLINNTLYPLGYLPQEALFLCIDRDSKVYMAGDNLHWIGDSFVQGVSNILLGISGKILDEQGLSWID